MVSFLRQKSIVFDGALRVMELPFVKLEYGDLLVKTIYVYIGHVEEAVLSYKVIPPRRLILGSSGVVKIVETTSNNISTGRTIIVSPISRHGILAYNLDGILSDYASMKPEHIFGEAVEPGPYEAVKPFVSHGVELGLEAVGVTVVAGCNITALSTALTLRFTGAEPVIYCESPARPAIQLGFQVVRHASNLPAKPDSLVLVEPNPSINYRLIRSLSPRKIVVSPFSFTTWIPVGSSINSVTLTYKGTLENREPGLTSKALRDLIKFINLVEIDDVEKSLGLMPPRGLGVILALKH